MLYSKLKYAHGVINSEVKKHQMYISFEEFTEICNLPYSGSRYQEIDQSEDFITVAFFSFLKDSDFDIPSPFLVGSMCPYIMMIHYVVNHIHIPRKYTLGRL